MLRQTRRQFLTALAGVSVGAALSACVAPAPASQPSAAGEAGSPAAPVELRMSGWANATVAAQMLQLLEKYNSTNEKGITVSGEFGDWGAHWERVNTQLAGGSAPDIIQFHPPMFPDYVSRDVLADLNQFMPDIISMEGIDKSSLGEATFGEKLVGMPTTMLGPAMLYNTASHAETGIELPSLEWTWEDHLAYSQAVGEASDIAGTIDGSLAGSQAFHEWLKTLGKDYWSPDGVLAFTQDDLIEWWSYWTVLRDNGWTVRPDDQTAVTNADPTTEPILKGLAVMSFQYSGDIPGWQNLTQDELAIHTYPGAIGEPAGQWLGLGDVLCINAASKAPEAAADVINWFLHTEEVATTIPGRIPAAKALRDAQRAMGDPVIIKIADYIDLISPIAGAPPVPGPKGASEVGTRQTYYNQEVAFGRLDIATAAADFFGEVDQILGA